MDDFEDKRVRATRLTADEMKEVQGGKSQAGEELHAWYLADLRYPCARCRAGVGTACRDEHGGILMLSDGQAVTHFCRRVRRLITEKRPDLLEKPS